jgi:hypothetical protein
MARSHAFYKALDKQAYFKPSKLKESTADMMSTKLRIVE